MNKIAESIASRCEIFSNEVTLYERERCFCDTAFLSLEKGRMISPERPERKGFVMNACDCMSLEFAAKSRKGGKTFWDWG
jgi:hypothetical protein